MIRMQGSADNLESSFSNRHEVPAYAPSVFQPLLVYAKSSAELRLIVRRIFELARDARLYFKASKRKLNLRKLRFLGMIISDQGIESDPETVKAIKKFPRP